MTSIITQINFINAVLRWISEFANSPLDSNSIPSNLTQPGILYKLFKILFHPEDFVVNHDEIDLNALFQQDNDIQFHESYYHVPIEIERQIKALEILLDNHINLQRKRLISPKKLKDVETILRKFNLVKLVIFKDINSITYFCELIFIIGTFSSKLSTFGLTSLQFLTDVDKLSITEYLGISIADLESKPNIQENDLNGSWDRDVISSLSSEDSSYVDADYLESIIWENKIFEKLAYSIITNELSLLK